MGNALELTVIATDKFSQVFARLSHAVNSAEQVFKQLYDVSKKFAQDTGDFKLQKQFAEAELAAKDLEQAILKIKIAGKDLPHLFGEGLQAGAQLIYIARVEALEVERVALNKELESLNAKNFLHFSQQATADKRKIEIEQRLLQIEKDKQAVGAQAATNDTRSTIELLKGAKIGDALKAAFKGIGTAAADANKQMKDALSIIMDLDDAIRKGDARAIMKAQFAARESGVSKKAFVSAGAELGFSQSRSQFIANTATQQPPVVNVYIDGQAVQGVVRTEMVRGLAGHQKY